MQNFALEQKKINLEMYKNVVKKQKTQLFLIIEMSN